MVDKRRGEGKVNDPTSGFAARGGEEARALLVDDLLGRDDWKGSKFGYVTGASFFFSAARRVGETFTGAFSRVGGLYGAATRGEDSSALPVIEESDASVRFEVAMEAYGKTEEDLTNMAKNSFRGFYFYAVMVAIMTVIGFASIAYGNVTGLPALLDSALRFAALPALFALMLRFGHLNWVVRNRRLDGPGAYILSGALFPTRNLGRVVATLLSVAVLAAFVMSPGQALASPVTDVFGQPSKEDVFFRMLGYVVPGIGPVTGHETIAHKAVAQGFLAFSGVLMFIGSLMLGWHVLNGTVQSAYTGKVLGERWHQIWAPGRVALGLGSLAPVAGGFGAAQVLVVYLIVWGGNLANAVWTPYVEALGKGITAPQQNSATEQVNNKLSQRLAGAEDVIYQIARRELCNATINRYNEVVYKGASSSSWGGLGGYGDTSMVTQNPTMRERGSFTDTLSNLAAWATDPISVSVTYTRKRVDYGSMCGTIEVTLGKVTSGDSKKAVVAHYIASEKFDEMRAEAIEEAISTIRPEAQKIAATYVPGGEKANALDQSKDSTRDLRNDFRNALEKAERGYRNKMMEAARQQLAALDIKEGGKSLVETLVKEASSKGWANAGAYYVTIAQVQSAVNAKAMTRPVFGDLNLTPGSQVSPNMLKSVAGTDTDPGAIVAFDNWWNAVVNSEFTPIDTDSAKAGRMDKKSDSAFSSMMDAIGTDGMLKNMIYLFNDMDPFNPMKSMIDFGHKVLMWFYFIMAVLLGASVISLVAGGNVKVAAAKLAMESFSSSGLGTVVVGFFTMLLFALFAVGVVHAYVIPMVPYIQVLFFLVGMMVLLVEALIAAPLWAFFHVRMDGGELIDQVQRPGYMIAFNLLLRPALMVLGLMMSYFVFGSMAWFISKTYTVAAVAAGAEHSVGPIGTIVMLCIMTYLHYQIALRSFGLINQVPDRVTRWFGHGSENLGEENENRQAVGFAVGNISSRTEGLLRAGGAGAGMKGAVAGANEAAGTSAKKAASKANMLSNLVRRMRR